MFDASYWIPAMLAIACVAMLSGVGLGWLFGRRDTSQVKDQEQRLRQLLERMHDLARSVAEDVDAHTCRLDEINVELTEQESLDPAAGLLVDTVAKIVDANKKLQGKLVSAEMRLEEQAAKIDFHLAEARVDSLTGLANRRAFDDELERRFAEWERTQIPFSLLLLDIDRFKSCNDQYGHLAGDEVLRNVAAVLAETMRQMDFVVRYGGEEFTAILPSTNLADGCAAAERVREILADAECRLEGNGLRITVCVGVSEVLPRDNPRTLFKRCDAALYAAKNDGRNCSFFHDAAGPSRVLLAVAPPMVQVTSTEKPWTEESMLDDVKIPSHIDPITAPLDRRTFVEHFQAHVQEARRLGRPLSLLLVCIDRLHKLNSWGGVAAVERAMHGIAEVTRSSLRESDLVGRYAWDQFAVLLPGMDVEHASQIETRLHAALDETRLPLGSGPRPVVFTGLAELWPDDDMTSFTRRAADDLEETKTTPEAGTRLHSETASPSPGTDVPSRRMTAARI